jgi:gas vesicle protein
MKEEFNMTKNQGGAGKKFVLGAFIGGLAGAATALFLAPKSGKELREDLNEQAMVVKDRTSGYTTIALDKGSELAEYAKQKTISLSQAVSEQTSQITDKVKITKEELSDEAAAVKEDFVNELEDKGEELLEEVAEQAKINEQEKNPL